MYTGPSCLGDFVEKTQSVIWMQTSAANMVNVYDTPFDTTKDISLFKKDLFDRRGVLIRGRLFYPYLQYKATSYSHLAIYIL